ECLSSVRSSRRCSPEMAFQDVARRIAIPEETVDNSAGIARRRDRATATDVDDCEHNPRATFIHRTRALTASLLEPNFIIPRPVQAYQALMAHFQLSFRDIHRPSP